VTISGPVGCPEANRSPFCERTTARLEFIRFSERPKLTNHSVSCLQENNSGQYPQITISTGRTSERMQLPLGFFVGGLRASFAVHVRVLFLIDRIALRRKTDVLAKWLRATAPLRLPRPLRRATLAAIAQGCTHFFTGTAPPGHPHPSWLCAHECSTNGNEQYRSPGPPALDCVPRRPLSSTIAVDQPDRNRSTPATRGHNSGVMLN
jgi:hypothetical protein